MRVPEICFNFAQLKDVSGGLIELVTRKLIFADNAVSVFCDIIEATPADKIFILTAAAVMAQAGGALALDNITLSYASEPGAPRFEFAREEQINTAVVARDRGSLNFSGELWIPPGSLITATGVFSGANAGNTVSGSLHGMFIPRGNIQQG